MTRRDCLAAFAGVAGGALLPGGVAAATPAKVLRGAFMILQTPFTTKGDVDWDDLAREAAFVDDSGCHGIVWPQGSSSVAMLTRSERLKGMEVLAAAMRGRRGALVLGVQGRNADEMLSFVSKANALGADALIAMPPTEAASLDDYRSYFTALGRATNTPTILQTSGGAKDLVPPTGLIIDLAREFPHLGYVKEESEPLVERLRARR